MAVTLRGRIKKMVDESATQHEALNSRLGLNVWGLKVFRKEENLVDASGQWRTKLDEALRLSDQAPIDEDEAQLGRGGPELVAAVCVRDHWDELKDDERTWCVDRVCAEVERERSQWSQMARLQRNSMSADRACAWVVPLLLGKILDERQLARVQHALVVAVTHAINEVRWYAAWGIGINLWTIDRELTLRCVNALALEATLVQQSYDVECEPRLANREN